MNNKVKVILNGVAIEVKQEDKIEAGFDGEHSDGEFIIIKRVVDGEEREVMNYHYCS